MVGRRAAGQEEEGLRASATRIGPVIGGVSGGESAARLAPCGSCSGACSGAFQLLGLRSAAS